MICGLDCPKLINFLQLILLNVYISFDSQILLRFIIWLISLIFYIFSLSMRLIKEIWNRSAVLGSAFICFIGLLYLFQILIPRIMWIYIRQDINWIFKSSQFINIKGWCIIFKEHHIFLLGFNITYQIFIWVGLNSSDVSIDLAIIILHCGILTRATDVSHILYFD